MAEWDDVPKWLNANGGAARKLALACRDGAVAFPVLADALEEAGCTDAAILGHCREGADAHHPEGCWVLAVLLDGRDVPAHATVGL